MMSQNEEMTIEWLDEDKINAIALPYLCLTGDPRDHEYGMPEDCLVAFVRDIESQIKARLAKPMVFKSTAKIALDMAIKFCEQRSISDDDPERERLVDAFCCGFDIVNQRLQKLTKEIYKQDHAYLGSVADDIEREFDKI
ncbi:MAG: hypothetical protein H7842_02415 [Gammaproteobacteria bacterium SHHR-1]